MLVQLCIGHLQIQKCCKSCGASASVHVSVLGSKTQRGLCSGALAGVVGGGSTGEEVAQSSCVVLPHVRWTSIVQRCRGQGSVWGALSISTPVLISVMF